MFGTIFSPIDWELFALIATPIISLLAFIVYGAALFTSIRQNKITTSASIIPYYEEEIRDLIESGLAIQFKDSSQNIALNALDFSSHLTSAFVFLEMDEYYQKDIEDGNFNGSLQFRDLEWKSYGKYLIFINMFFGGMTDINSHFNKIESLIKNIEASELTLSHKKILKWKIRKKLALPFLVTFYQMRYYKGFPKEIPISALHDFDAKEYLALFEVKETDFYQTLVWMDKCLTQS